jgi:acetyltransferase-like isoleucine patch superfamily enzyme
VGERASDERRRTNGVVVFDAGTPQSRDIWAKVQRAIGVTERLNRIPFADRAALQQTWSELTGAPADQTFMLIPPVYCDHGLNISVGHNVFINQGCSLLDIGGIAIEDDVMIGPNVSLITAGHPLDPRRRRRQIVAAPICIRRNAWLGAGASVLGGVTIGENSVVAAGAVVTNDVPEGTLVAGVPARVLRSVLTDDHATSPPPGR